MTPSWREMQKDFDSALGRAIASFTEKEKIKLASFPLAADRILMISIKKEEQNHIQIIQGILDIIQELKLRREIESTYGGQNRFACILLP